MNKYPAILIVVCAILGGALARDFVLPAASAQPIGQPAGAQLAAGSVSSRSVRLARRGRSGSRYRHGDCALLAPRGQR